MSEPMTDGRLIQLECLATLPPPSDSLQARIAHNVLRELVTEVKRLRGLNPPDTFQVAEWQSFQHELFAQALGIEVKA